MAEDQTPKTKTFKVTSAFVWDKVIRTPGDTLALSVQQAHGLKARGKIEEVTDTGKGKTATAKTSTAKTSDE